MSAGRRGSRLALAIASIPGLALVLALAVAWLGSGGVSANATCNTTLAQAAGAGAEGIIVSGATGCDIGDKIVLNQGGGTEECQEIESVAPGTVGDVIHLVGTLVYYHSQGETVVEVPACPTPAPTETETPPPTETATPTPTPTPIATLNQMYNCPQAGKWALAVWQGTDGITANEALATCGEGAVDAVYALDASSGEWLRWFPDRPELSKLTMVERMQGLFVLGSPTASPIPTVGLMPPESGQMWGCPLPGRWSLAVWEGPDATEAGAALDTCGVWRVDAAYSLNPMGHWEHWFADRAELSTLHDMPFLWVTVAANILGASDSIAFESDRDGNWEIYVMASTLDNEPTLPTKPGPRTPPPELEGAAHVRITNNPASDRLPAWSPDRSKIAFVSDRFGNDDIFIMNANGSMQADLTNNPADDYDPVWSPDGSKIAFASDRNGTYGEIYVMNADGTGQTRLTNYAATDDSHPTWSPDGSKIAFQSYRDGNYEIYVMNANGTVQANATLNAASDKEPAWSPDGSKITFWSNRQDWGDIYVMNADGTGQTRLTSQSGYDVCPAWSPDGSKIAFASDRSLNYEIYVMNANGTGQTRLTYYPLSYDEYPAWSP